MPPLALADVLKLAAIFIPKIVPKTVPAFAPAQSGMNPLSIYDNNDYKSYLQNLVSNMVPLAERPLSFGNSIVLGPLEKSHQNSARTDFTLETASNLPESARARGIMLGDTCQCYDGQLDRVCCMTSKYNTGHLARASITGIPRASRAPLSSSCPPIATTLLTNTHRFLRLPLPS